MKRARFRVTPALIAAALELPPTVDVVWASARRDSAGRPMIILDVEDRHDSTNIPDLQGDGIIPLVEPICKRLEWDFSRRVEGGV